MRTIPFYSDVNDFSVERFIERFEEAKDFDEPHVFVRASSPGGNPYAGWGLILTIKDFLAESSDRKVDYRAEGLCASMMAFVTLFVSNATAIEQCDFMFHRASAPAWAMDDEMMARLERINDHLKKALEKAVDKAKWKQITGVSINDMFDANKDRIDVRIKAKDAKKLGIIQKVVSLSPVEANELNSRLVEAKLDPIKIEPKAEETEENFDQNTDKKMTVEEIKSKYPEAYEAILKTGKEQEKDRVEAWMEFAEIDPKKVHEGIKAGDNLGQKDFASFNATAMKNGFVQKAQEDSADGADTTGDDDQDDDLGDDDGADPEASDNVVAFEKELDKLSKK